MRVAEADRPSRVRWDVLVCEPASDWVGTTITFDLVPAGDGTELRFHHHGLNPQLECFDQCQAGMDTPPGQPRRLRRPRRRPPEPARRRRALRRLAGRARRLLSEQGRRGSPAARKDAPMTPEPEEPAAPAGPDAVLRALADPHRRQILRLVQHAELPAGQIASHFDLTQQAVSQHLTVLKRAGLLAERREGTRRLYSLRSESLAATPFPARRVLAGRARPPEAVRRADPSPHREEMTDVISTSVRIAAPPEVVFPYFTDPAADRHLDRGARRARRPAGRDVRRRLRQRRRPRHLRGGGAAAPGRLHVGHPRRRDASAREQHRRGRARRRRRTTRSSNSPTATSRRIANRPTSKGGRRCLAALVDAAHR